MYRPLWLLNIDIFDDSVGYVHLFRLGLKCVIITFSVWHETVHLFEHKQCPRKHAKHIFNYQWVQFIVR